MRVLFIVQGEGRGHLTQALAVGTFLEKAGHELACVLAGSVRHRKLPGFFAEKIAAPMERFDSPGFSLDEDHRSIRPLSTFIENVGRVRAFKQSLQLLDRTIRKVRPDLVLTYYEPLAGVYQALYRPEAPFVAVGHQHMFGHPAYTFAPGDSVDRAAITLFTRLTGLGAAWRLALSLYPAPDLPDRRLSVLPPLLRTEVFDRERTYRDREQFFVIYLLNRGYAGQVIRWHERHPDWRLECFWDNPDVDDVVRHDETLTFHRLHDTKFLDLMARCSGLISTAGFESVSEALFFGKPVLAVPVEGHYEQRCNAYEVELLGAGLRSDRFDPTLLQEFIARYNPPLDAFRQWVSLAESRVIDVLERIAGGNRPTVSTALKTPAAAT